MFIETGDRVSAEIRLVAAVDLAIESDGRERTVAIVERGVAIARELRQLGPVQHRVHGDHVPWCASGTGRGWSWPPARRPSSDRSC